MWGLCTPLLTSEKLPGCIISPLSVFKIWSYILLIWNLSLSAPNFKETQVVVIKHGGIAETAISGVIEMIDSMPTTVIFFSLRGLLREK
jgi:hypothetical protein